MRTETFGHFERHAKPLALRGGPARTFGSLAYFVALLFLLSGVYLLVDAFVHPLDAQAVGVLAAALSITLAAILLYFQLKSRKRKHVRGVRFRRAA